MLKQIVIFAFLSIAANSAEISQSYSLLEKHASFNPEIKTEPVEHGLSKKEPKLEEHPVYRGEGRARIEPVNSQGPVVKHDMLSDQPSTGPASADVNRVDTLATQYVYGPAPHEVAYPDIPYAPGYGYDSAYAPSNNYETYSNNGLSNYYLEPDTSAFGLLWSQVPDARTIVNYVGRTIVWILNGFILLFLGSFVTVGFCSYTNLCSISFTGVGPIHEEMRSLITPERLEKISTAADFVKTAIDKYQKIQTPNELPRYKRSIFF